MSTVSGQGGGNGLSVDHCALGSLFADDVCSTLGHNVNNVQWTIHLEKPNRNKNKTNKENSNVKRKNIKHKW